ncbi:MAG: GNAT family N-acetyltransferase [Candidatus Thermoplasmatota archaeon]|nr:GNAT family N-acetyltransferase [Candidatus Thermoplasmatota archaeon]
MVATTDSISINIAHYADFNEIEAAWWRLLHDQQQLDYRGPESELQSQHNIDRVHRFLESRIRQERLVIARFEGDLAGICTFAPDGFLLESPIQIWEISDVWVEPFARRKGIASALVRYTEIECKMRGASEVRLSVYSENEGALELYKSLGYDVRTYSLSRHLED